MCVLAILLCMRPKLNSSLTSRNRNSCLCLILAGLCVVLIGFCIYFGKIMLRKVFENTI